jgi:CTP synthase
MTIEVARNLAGLRGANSTEFDERAEHPVIATMAEQQDIVAGRGDLGGTMRLGAYPARLVEGSQVAEAYGSTEISERHRHRYEVNNAYREALDAAGLRISGTSPDGRLVEFIELDRKLHPFFVATQAHPELKSRPTRSHPLFAAFVGAVLAYSQADQLPVNLADPVAPSSEAGDVGAGDEQPDATGAGSSGRPRKAGRGS